MVSWVKNYKSDSRPDSWKCCIYSNILSNISTSSFNSLCILFLIFDLILSKLGAGAVLLEYFDEYFEPRLCFEASLLSSSLCSSSSNLLKVDLRSSMVATRL